MKKTAISFLSSVLCVLVFMAGCSFAMSKYDNITLRLSCNGTDFGNDTRAARLFAELVEKKSEGLVKIQVFNGDQLASGNMQQAIGLLLDGTVELDVHSTSIISTLDNNLMVSTLPWIFANYEVAEEKFYGKGGEYIQKLLAPKGIRYLGAVHNGFKAMTCSKRQIKSPEDLKGLKMRIPGGEFFSAFYSTFGASPQAMSWAEVFTALQQGTIDGHDNSLSTISSNNIQEVQKYISISNHTYEAFTFMANEVKFSNLSKDTQDLIIQSVEEATKITNRKIIEEESALIEKFKTVTHNEIYAFTPNDIAEFKAIIAPLMEKYKGIYGDEACQAFEIQ